jgi:hypothetical protein
MDIVVAWIEPTVVIISLAVVGRRSERMSGEREREREREKAAEDMVI